MLPAGQSLRHLVPRGLWPARRPREHGTHKLEAQRPGRGRERLLRSCWVDLRSACTSLDGTTAIAEGRRGGRGGEGGDRFGSGLGSCAVASSSAGLSAGLTRRSSRFLARRSSRGSGTCAHGGRGVAAWAHGIEAWTHRAAATSTEAWLCAGQHPLRRVPLLLAPACTALLALRQAVLHELLHAAELATQLPRLLVLLLASRDCTAAPHRARRRPLLCKAKREQRAQHRGS